MISRDKWNPFAFAAVKQGVSITSPLPWKAHPVGKARKKTLSLDCHGSVRLEFCGATISSDAALLVGRDVHDALALTALLRQSNLQSTGGSGHPRPGQFSPDPQSLKRQDKHQSAHYRCAVNRRKVSTDCPRTQTRANNWNTHFQRVNGSPCHGRR